MQTSKSNRPTTLEAPSKTSPVTPRTTHQLKTTGSGSDSPASRTPKDRSPKVMERRSPRSPVTEKKRPSRVSELESQVSRLQDDLKKTRDQLASSESWKKQAQEESEETKKQLVAMSAKLEESQHQLLELSASEEARVHKIQQTSQDQNQTWETELEAALKQQSVDSVAMASANDEIQKLKNLLGMAVETEGTHADIQKLQLELSETLNIVGKMRTELDDCKESEANVIKTLDETNLQLKSTKATAETLRSEGLKAAEAYNSLTLQFELSKARVSSLEGLVSKLQTDAASSGSKGSPDHSESIIQAVLENEDNGETKQLKEELNFMKIEANQLKCALDAAEIKYHEQYAQSTLHIRNAYEQVEQAKSQSCLREAELEIELKKAKADIEELMEKLLDKETKIQNLSNENEGLNIARNQSRDKESKLISELKKSEADLADLKAYLVDKETEFQSITEENKMLKMEMQNKMQKNKANDDPIAWAEAARAAEREALMKLAYLTEEAEKNSRRAARLTEQLDDAQTVNSDMESELRKLKVQSDQWRKAAEAAAAMISTGHNGKFVERAGSLDNNYHSIGMKMGSPFSDDMDDISPKKKNGNVLKKIGVLWKKSHK